MGNSKSIKLDRTYQSPIGVGSFGTVYKAVYGDDTVAVKIINLHMLKHSPAMEKYRNIDKNELVPFLKKLEHRNIVSFVALEDKYPELWLALEYCDGGSLDKYLHDHDPNDEKSLDLVQQAADGLAYLHSNNVIHRDIKPDNFLIALRHDSGPVVKITDFSLCKDVDGPSGSTMTTVRGNKDWLAPELVTEDGHGAVDIKYKRSVDVFSYALVIIYVCMNTAGRAMFFKAFCGSMVKSGRDVLEYFHVHWRSSELRDMLKPLLASMLRLDPETRPTMAEVAMLIPRNCPTVELRASLSLDFKANWCVGIGGENCIFMGCNDNLRLYKLKSSRYYCLWKKTYPQGMRSNHRKYVSSNSLVARDWFGNDPTFHMDLHMNPVQQHHVDRGRILVGVLPPYNTMVYSERTDNRSQLVMYNEESKVMTIPLPEPFASSPQHNGGLSICQRPGTDWTAVCLRNSCKLAVYDGLGVAPRFQTNLNYRPGAWNAIACTERHVIVSQDDSTWLHVHAWTGVEIGSVDVRERICGGGGVGGSKHAADSAVVQAVGVCGDVLHVALGSCSEEINVTSVFAFDLG